MKQTNNAIKFLMAQYRAIFKNANIAMLAAIAASALAAGQAQAAGPVNVTEWGQLETGSYNGGTSGDADKKFEIEGAADGKNNNANGFAVEVVSGAHFIKGSGDNTSFTVAEGKDASITIKANGKTAPTVLIAGKQDTDFANVTIKEFSNLGGTLTIKGHTSDATKTSSLVANKINIGHATEKLKANASVVLDKNSVLGSADTTEFQILQSGSLTFSGAGSKAISKDGIILNGGTISTAESAEGTIVNGLKVQSGALNVAGGTAGSTLAVDKLTVSNKGAVVVSGGTVGGKLNVESVTVQSGTVTVSGGAKAGKLTVSNDLNVSGGTVDLATGTSGGELEVQGKTNFTGGKLNIAESGAFTIKDNATFAKGTIGTINANGAFKVDTTAKSVDLNIAQAELKSLLGGAFSASGNNNFNLVLTDAGETLDLSKSGLVNNDGKSKIAMTAGTGVANIKTAGAATYLKGQFNSATGYDFKTMTVGDSNTFKISGGATVTVHNGITVSGDATKTSLTVEKGTLNLDGSGSVASKTLAVSGASAKLNVTGKWSVNDLTLNEGNTKLTDAELTIAGTLTSDNASGKLDANSSKIFVDGKNAALKVSNGKITLNNASELHVDAADVLSGTSINGTNLAKNKLDSDANSKLVLKSAEAVKMTKDQFKQFTSDTGFKGIIDGITLTDHNVSGTKTLDQLVTNGTAGQEDVTASVGNTAVSGNYTVGNAQLSEESDTSLELGAGGNLTLVDASIGTNNQGNFVSKKNGKVADVVMQDTTNGNTLTLAGSGNIGAIKTDTAGKGQVTFGTATKKGTVNVNGTIGANGTELEQVTLNGSNVTVTSGDVYAYNVDLNGGSLKLDSGKSLVIGSGNAALASELNGDVTAGTLTVLGNSGSLSLSEGANVSVSTFNGDKEVLVQVGADTVENGTASLFAGTLNLKSGTLFVDPEYGEHYAAVTVTNFSSQGTTQADDKSAGLVDGKINVGKNAALGVGFESKAELDAILADYVDADGSFYKSSSKGLANALVLNKAISLGQNDGIYVAADATTSTATDNKVTIKNGAGLIITDKVFTPDSVTGKKTGIAITVNDAATIDVTGAQLKLIGNFTGADKGLQIFSDTTNPISGTMTIKSANDLLNGVLDAKTGKMDLKFERDAAVNNGAFADASEPVRNMLLDQLDGKLAYSKAIGYQLIADAATASLSGAVVDAAAHAATYAGAQQAAVLSVTTMADAMFGRVGAVGVEAASIAATGSQANGGVWLTPMYKSMDSDGFNAQGASYGSDVDLSGVAFGADTVNGNMRFGAVFNIGSGDADGKGNGNGLKDEFDYYGFGIYSAMGFGNFALVGDASMTVISHDVEGLGLRGKADTTAVTMGVTGQYTVATPSVDVTPHLGARFIRLNTDSYDLISAKGVEATTDFDVQNVFSVPLGVTLSKGFVAGGWTLAPSADLSVTFNTGDTEAKSTTTFTGVKAINLNTEVLDEVQYGVTLGLGAQYGAFGTSFGINYTGSSNTDSFGVNAQCRYMF
ncbi:beta strand repeat-containing protein [Anaerobiospirillum succiniciproducens]|uniref:beta strand repeat-containing protein n=1 Tax=Anaerobiospirillum succiniciproducens TaxID=13335 RepID=UPI000426566A|nr:autotransporter outer membrane beta-barrel domain-containing protein [Anaerobiospirillum succiniciproducens]